MLAELTEQLESSMLKAESSRINFKNRVGQKYTSSKNTLSQIKGWHSTLIIADIYIWDMYIMSLCCENRDSDYVV